MKEKNKLENIIKQSDKDNKGGIYIHEFKDYFIKSAIENNPMVWRLLNLSGYRNNLKHKSEPDVALVETSFPRKLLSHSYVYNSIFSILAN